jgi:hypothetical protein
LYYYSERHVALAEERITMPIAPRAVNLRVFGLILLILTFIQWPVASQTTGRIAGTVKEQSGAVIVGAEVLVVSESSGDQRKVITDQAGNYSVPLLPPGVYRVTIRASGFAEAWASPITCPATAKPRFAPDSACSMTRCKTASTITGSRMWLHSTCR